jgi:hypothetical protein
LGREKRERKVEKPLNLSESVGKRERERWKEGQKQSTVGEKKFLPAHVRIWILVGQNRGKRGKGGEREERRLPWKGRKTGGRSDVLLSLFRRRQRCRFDSRMTNGHTSSSGNE